MSLGVKHWRNSVDSYFISQDEEGQMELVGVRRLYSNMISKGMITGKVTPIASFGIGRGTSQWTYIGDR
jgi:hypothetical protein